MIVVTESAAERAEHQGQERDGETTAVAESGLYLEQAAGRMAAIAAEQMATAVPVERGPGKMLAEQPEYQKTAAAVAAAEREHQDLH